jgi:membrane complex biogenesis BtpA family protein
MTRRPPLPLPFHAAPAVVGMVHLPALPDAPAHSLPMTDIIEAALHDADALIRGGVDGLIVENLGDVPFHGHQVSAATVAALTRVVTEVCAHAGDVPVGVNVLRNDANAALAIAAATGARFVRVNVHTGSMFTDQGLLQGRAAETLRTRERLCPDVALFADVHVKHAVPVPGEVLEDAARDAWHRGLADALIVSGAATGAPTDPARVARVVEAVDGAPVWVGSGAASEQLAELEAAGAHGFIVGSALRRDGAAGAPVEPHRVDDFMQAVAGCRSRRP